MLLAASPRISPAQARVVEPTAQLVYAAAPACAARSALVMAEANAMALFLLTATFVEVM